MFRALIWFIFFLNTVRDPWLSENPWSKQLKLNQCVGLDQQFHIFILLIYMHLSCHLVEKRVRPIILVIKKWASHHRINDASRGTLSSYTLVLMVLHYLQSKCQRRHWGLRSNPSKSSFALKPNCFQCVARTKEVAVSLWSGMLFCLLTEMIKLHHFSFTFVYLCNSGPVLMFTIKTLSCLALPDPVIPCLQKDYPVSVWSTFVCLFNIRVWFILVV